MAEGILGREREGEIMSESQRIVSEKRFQKQKKKEEKDPTLPLIFIFMLLSRDYYNKFTIAFPLYFLPFLSPKLKTFFILAFLSHFNFTFLTHHRFSLPVFFLFFCLFLHFLTVLFTILLFKKTTYSNE